MSAIIRPYTPADFAACRSLWGDLAQHHRDIYENPSLFGGDPGAAFEPYLATEGLLGPWVAEVDGQVVGFCGLIVEWGRGEIEPVIVSTGLRSQGVGHALVEHAIEQARGAGVGTLMVRPVARNAEAIAFFVRAGFRTVSQLDLVQDLSGTDAIRRKSGDIRLHGHELNH